MVFWALVSSGQNLLVSVEQVGVVFPVFGIGTLINLIVSVISARSLGVPGVILGTTVGNAVACILYLIAFRRVFGVTVNDFWTGVLRRVYPQACLGALVVAGLTAWHPPDGWLVVSLYGAAGWLTFAVLFVLTGLPGDEREALVKQVRAGFTPGSSAKGKGRTVHDASSLGSGEGCGG